MPQLTAAEQVIGAPDAEEVFLDLGEAGRATVVRSKAKDRAVIKTEDMVSAPAGKVYELWLMSPEGVVHLGRADARRTPTRPWSWTGPPPPRSAVGITVEPDGGSEKPTTDPIAFFDLTEAT